MRRLATLVLGVLLLASGTALAQDTGDISGGYRFLRSEGVNFPAGWYFDVTRHLNDVFSIVGDVGGTYKNESETAGGITAEANLSVHTFAGGVKARAATSVRNISVFGQALFGAGRGSAEVKVGGTTVVDESSTDALLNFSGGVDITGSGSIGVRAMLGYLRILEDEGANFFALSIGVKIRF